MKLFEIYFLSRLIWNNIDKYILQEVKYLINLFFVVIPEFLSALLRMLFYHKFIILEMEKFSN